MIVLERQGRTVQQDRAATSTKPPWQQPECLHIHCCLPFQNPGSEAVEIESS